MSLLLILNPKTVAGEPPAPAVRAELAARRIGSGGMGTGQNRRDRTSTTQTWGRPRR